MGVPAQPREQQEYHSHSLLLQPALLTGMLGKKREKVSEIRIQGKLHLDPLCSLPLESQPWWTLSRTALAEMVSW